MKTTSKLLLVDGNNLFYRAYFSHRKLSSFNGQNVSAIFGCLNILSSMLQKLNIDEVIVCWDGKKDKNRLALLPEYKAKRKKLGFDYEDMNDQKDKLKPLLEALGIKQIVNNREADDMIYKVVRLKKKTKPIIILSTDKDFDQLITDNIWVYNEKYGFLTKKNLRRLKGYKPSQCVDYLCLRGDDSDNIPGYKGMGEKSCWKFFQQFNSIDEYLASEEKMRGLDKDKLKALLVINKPLIDLKVFHTSYLKGVKLEYYNNCKKPPLDIKKYTVLAASLGLRQYREEKFINLFKKLNHG